jgi:hypothetical protein
LRHYSKKPEDLKTELEKKIGLETATKITLISCQAGLIPEKKTQSYAQDFADLFSITKPEMKVYAPAIPQGALDSIVTSKSYEEGKSKKKSVKFEISMAVEDGIPALSELTENEIATLKSSKILDSKINYDSNTLFTKKEVEQIKNKPSINPVLQNKIQTMLTFKVDSFRQFSDVTNTYIPKKPSKKITLNQAVLLSAIHRIMKDIHKKKDTIRSEMLNTADNESIHKFEGDFQKYNSDENKFFSFRTWVKGRNFTPNDLIKKLKDFQLDDYGMIIDQYNRCCKTNLQSPLSNESNAQRESKGSSVPSIEIVYNIGPIRAFFAWLFGIDKLVVKSFESFLTNEKVMREAANEMSNSEEKIQTLNEALESKKSGIEVLKAEMDLSFLKLAFNLKFSLKGIVSILLSFVNINAKENEKIKEAIKIISSKEADISDKIKYINTVGLFTEDVVEKINNNYKKYAQFETEINQTEEDISKETSYLDQLVIDKSKIIEESCNTKDQLRQELIAFIDGLKPTNPKKREALTYVKEFVNNPDEKTWNKLDSFIHQNKTEITKGNFVSRVGYILEKTADFKRKFWEIKNPEQNKEEETSEPATVRQK